MAQAQRKREIEAQGRLSYCGTLDRVSAWHKAFWNGSSKRAMAKMKDQLLQAIADDPLPERPSRRKLTVNQHRPKNYKLMTRPRSTLKAHP